MKKPVLLAIIICFATIPRIADSQQRVVLRPELTKPENIEKWIIDGSGSWHTSGGKLVLHKAGVPSGPIRRPAALAILKTKPFRRVTIEADIRSTAPLDTVRRDLDIIVGYESPSRFYYIHLAGISDNVHNGIFLVNNSNRVRIDGGTGEPQLKDSTWHHVRVERDGLTGQIEVFMDRSKKPALEARDTTICCGRVGFGSFDDTGEIRRISIKGVEK
ncbi:MAG: hypothetical protein Q8P51_05575 [Ignavibacteria bacterium]|nr:hypothetical protein [Ignavibacteria bacterium]